MTKYIRWTGAVASVLTFPATAAWAASNAATPVIGNPAGVQGPDWSGYGPGPWMMGGWGGGPMMGYGGWGGGGLTMLMMMLFGGVILVALLVLMFRALASGPHHPHQTLPYPPHGSVGLHALDERYARGEINREEYLQKKKDILTS